MSDQFPTYRAQMEYVCLGCGARHPIDELLYTCPSCGGVFLLEDTTFDKLKEHGGAYWRNLFDSWLPPGTRPCAACSGFMS